MAGHEDLSGPRAPELARRDEARTGQYHLWSPQLGMNTAVCPRITRCWSLPHVPEEQLSAPVTAALVPVSQRCGQSQGAGWPLYVPRPWAGPLPYNWEAGKIPRWYVWWRLFELQDGRCACCNASPSTIDHDHRTGAVRGLLCTSCNRLETDYFRRKRMCVHVPPHCFEDYWRTPPALTFRWIRTSPTVFRHS
ncbi:endonuclease domain-containing protein [Streptomyces syringium]|uniref:endonuclease domain-containing protein n=1 Tax=Streptomyces syringium TaxID=76729 RepID=UPI0037D7825E